MRYNIIIKLGLLAGFAAGVASAAYAADSNIVVEEVAHGSTIALVMSAHNCTEATITISAELSNVSSSVALPITIDTAGKTHLTLVVFTPINARLPWNFVWKGDWKYGRRMAAGQVPADYAYALPYRSGAHTVIQAANGQFSHYAGSNNEEAIDFEMPIGTSISAARSGVVVAMRTDCTEGGLDPKLKYEGNYVVLRHDDGTFAEYLHLMKDGVLVHMGDTVSVNQTIALSGYTGYTSAPHLHFEVFYTVDGSARKSLPITFTAAHVLFTPVEGNAYMGGL